MEKKLLCADIGTSSLKAGILSEGSKVLASCRIRFRETRSSAAFLWINAFMQASRQLVQETGCTPDGLVISGNGPTLVCAPESPNISDNPFTLLWNQKLTSCKHMPSEADFSLFLPRIRWLYDNKPRIWQKAQYVFSGPEYIVWKLTGTPVTILPEQRYLEAYWTDKSLAAWKLEDSRLPSFVSPGFNAGALTAQAAQMLSLPQKTQVFCGAPDFIAALVGTNTLRPGSACDRAGTSEGINVCTKEPITAPEVRTLPSIIPGLYNAGYLLPNTGAVFSSFKYRSGWKDSSYTACMEALLNGPHTSRGYRLIEETAFRIRRGVETLLEAGAHFSCLRISGGQARNMLWNQIKADILGIPLQITAIPDGELTGDAVFGFFGMGIFSSIEEGANRLVSVSNTFEPDQEKHRLFTERYKDFLREYKE